MLTCALLVIETRAIPNDSLFLEWKCRKLHRVNQFLSVFSFLMNIEMFMNARQESIQCTSNLRFTV